MGYPSAATAMGVASVVDVLVPISWRWSRSAHARAKRAICDKQGHAQIPPAPGKKRRSPRPRPPGVRVWPKISTAAIVSVVGGRKKRTKADFGDCVAFPPFPFSPLKRNIFICVQC